MKIYICTRILRDKKKIIGYLLAEEYSLKKPILVLPAQLKVDLIEGHYCVKNLKLTKDNKIIENKDYSLENEQFQYKTEEDLIKYVAKMRLMGKGIELKTACEIPCILISKNSYNHLIYIPDNVEDLNGFHTVFIRQIKRLEGKIQVVGGKGLLTTMNMFTTCKARYIDFTYFHTENVIDMSNMFYMNYAERLDLRPFNTKNVVNMSSMFQDSSALKIDLSSFKTPKLQRVNRMFRESRAKFLDLSTLDTSKVINMAGMFNGCTAEKIDITNFNTKKANMSYMFAESYIKVIDLRNFIFNEKETETYFDIVLKTHAKKIIITKEQSKILVSELVKTNSKIEII